MKCADLSPWCLCCIKYIKRHAILAEPLLSLQNPDRSQSLWGKYAIIFTFTIVLWDINHGIHNLNPIRCSLCRKVSFKLYYVLWVQTSKLEWIDPKPLSASGLAFHFPSGCSSWIAAHQIFKDQITWGWLSLLSAWVSGLKRSSSSSLAVFSNAKPSGQPAKPNKHATLYC